jgi:glycosyltransferase involved in cell wall biosynthesis
MLRDLQEKTMPKISAIMTVYNGEKYLKKAVDSILEQTFTDFEFIIVNDGSTDQTQAILDSCHDSRMIILNNHRNIGRSGARNKAIKTAKGEYIAIMDADDVSLPGRFEEQVKFLELNRDIALVGSSYFLINENDKVVGIQEVLTEKDKIKKDLSIKNQFGHSTIMVKRKCLESVGGYREEFKLAEDYDLYLRLSELFDLSNLKAPLSKWRIDFDSFSVAMRNELDKYAEFAKGLAGERKKYGKDRLQTSNDEEIKKILNDMLSWTKVMSEAETERTKRKIIAKFYQVHGAIWLAQKKLQQAREQFFISLQYNPRIIKTYIYFCLTFLPLRVTEILRCGKRKLYRQK